MTNAYVYIYCLIYVFHDVFHSHIYVYLCKEVLVGYTGAVALEMQHPLSEYERKHFFGIFSYQFSNYFIFCYMK